MLKILLKKQLQGLFKFFFVDPKKGKGRSKLSSAVLIVAYFLLIGVVLGFTFGVEAILICPTMHEIGLDWLYYAIMALIALTLGVVGSVFSTYTGLYKATDNDLLFSMPIPAETIMASRLLGVYIMGLIFAAIAFIPAVVVYFMVAGITVTALIGSIVMLFVLSLTALLLSCLLGWIVAKISTRVRNKSMVTVIVSLVLLFGYMYFVNKANLMLSDFLARLVAEGMEVHGAVYLLYAVGMACTGNVLYLLVVAAVIVIATFAVWQGMKKSFLKLATASDRTVKTVYREKTAKQKSIASAMFGKELRMFLSKPNYILNCGLGAIMMLVGVVALIFKGRDTIDVLLMVFGSREFLAVMAIAAVAGISSMVYTAEPSVSLEGRNIWIAQSLPMDPWMALQAKLRLQLVLTVVPAVLLAASLLVLLQPGMLLTVEVLALTVITVWFFACLNLMLGMHFVNLNWTNEVYVIKQSVGVLIAMTAGFVYALILAGGFIALEGKVSAQAYLGIFIVLTLGAAAALYRWLKTKGAAKFAYL